MKTKPRPICKEAHFPWFFYQVQAQPHKKPISVCRFEGEARKTLAGRRSAGTKLLGTDSRGARGWWRRGSLKESRRWINGRGKNRSPRRRCSLRRSLYISVLSNKISSLLVLISQQWFDVQLGSDSMRAWSSYGACAIQRIASRSLYRLEDLAVAMNICVEIELSACWSWLHFFDSMMI